MICIKDMKIPQSCDACRFYSYSDNGDYCSASEHCLDITNLVDTRHKDCPLAEIDVAKELEKIKEKIEVIKKSNDSMYCVGVTNALIILDRCIAELKGE